VSDKPTDEQIDKWIEEQKRIGEMPILDQIREHERKRGATLRVVGQRSECATPTILNMVDFISKNKT